MTGPAWEVKSPVDNQPDRLTAGCLGANRCSPRFRIDRCHPGRRSHSPGGAPLRLRHQLGDAFTPPSSHHTDELHRCSHTLQVEKRAYSEPPGLGKKRCEPEQTGAHSTASGGEMAEWFNAHAWKVEKAQIPHLDPEGPRWTNRSGNATCVDLCRTEETSTGPIFSQTVANGSIRWVVQDLGTAKANPEDANMRGFGFSVHSAESPPSLDPTPMAIIGRLQIDFEMGRPPRRRQTDTRHLHRSFWREGRGIRARTVGEDCLSASSTSVVPSHHRRW